MKAATNTGSHYLKSPQNAALPFFWVGGNKSLTAIKLLRLSCTQIIHALHLLPWAKF